MRHMTLGYARARLRAVTSSAWQTGTRHLLCVQRSRKSSLTLVKPFIVDGEFSRSEAHAMVCSKNSEYSLFSFPNLPWALLLVIYAPIGLFLTLLRVCMSLQAMLLLVLFPEGTVKR